MSNVDKGPILCRQSKPHRVQKTSSKGEACTNQAKKGGMCAKHRAEIKKEALWMHKSLRRIPSACQEGPRRSVFHIPVMNVTDQACP